MTQPPFSGNDFFDQIDSVARNLTGNAFRLKKNDPTAPQKFTEFVAQSEQEFSATQPQAAPQSFRDFEQSGFVSPEVAEARLQDPDWVASQTQPTFAGNEGAPGPAGMALQALANITAFGGGQFSSITGAAPQEFKDALAAERAFINSVPANNPFERFAQSIESNLFAPSKAFRQTTGDYPQIGVTQEFVDEAGNVLSSALPIAGIPLDVLTPDPTDPQQNQFHVGTGDLLEAVTDPLNFLGPGSFALKGAGSRVVTGAGKKALSAADEAAAAVGRTGVGNVLDPVPPQTVAGRAAGGAGDVEPKFSSRISGDYTKRTRKERIQALASGELEKNYTDDLEIFADRIWREQSADEARRALLGGDNTIASEIPTANTPDLALGQRGNKGVLIEYSTEGMKGRPDLHSKPGLKFIAQESGNAEISVRLESVSSLGKRAISAVLDPKIADKREMKLFERAIKNSERFDREVLPDGKIRFTPKQAITQPTTPATGTAAARGTGDAIDQLPVYEGEAWRTPSGFSQDRGTTAGDVIRFEREELGNVDTFSGISDELLAELDQFDADDVQWVARSSETARQYNTGNVTETVSDIQGGRIVHESEDGILVLRPDARKKTTPARGTLGEVATEGMIPDDVIPRGSVKVTPAQVRMFDLYESIEGALDFGTTKSPVVSGADLLVLRRMAGNLSSQADIGDKRTENMMERLLDKIDALPVDPPTTPSTGTAAAARGAGGEPRVTFTPNSAMKPKPPDPSFVAMMKADGKEVKQFDLYPQNKRVIGEKGVENRIFHGTSLEYDPTDIELRGDGIWLTGKKKVADRMATLGPSSAVVRDLEEAGLGLSNPRTVEYRIKDGAKIHVVEYWDGTSRAGIPEPYASKLKNALEDIVEAAEDADVIAMRRVRDILGSEDAVYYLVRNPDVLVPAQPRTTPARGTTAARQVTPQQQAIIDDVDTGALPADDVAVDALDVAPVARAADDASLRAIEDATPVRADLPSDVTGGKPPTARIDDTVPPVIEPDSGFRELRPMQENLDVAFNETMNTKIGRAIQSTQAGRVLTGFNPTLGANNEGKRALIGFAHSLEEGTLQADRLISQIDEIGSRQGLFGDIDDSGLFMGGEFKGLSLNEVREKAKLPAFRARMTAEQENFINVLGELDQAASAFMRKHGQDIGFTQDEDILFASRRIYGQFDNNGELISTRIDPDLPRGLGTQSSAQKARSVRTAEQLREQGFVLLPYDEVVKLRVRQSYRIAAEDNLVKWVKENYEFAPNPTNKNYIEGQKRLFDKQVATTAEGEQFLEDLVGKGGALEKFNKSAPEFVGTRSVGVLNNFARTFVLAGDASIFTIQLLAAVFEDFLPVSARGGLRGTRPKLPGRMTFPTVKNFATSFARGMLSPENARRVNARTIKEATDEGMFDEARQLIMLSGDNPSEFTESVGTIRNVNTYLRTKGGTRKVAGKVATIYTRPLEAFQEAFIAAINTAGLQLWRALKPLTKNADGTVNPQKLADVEDFINNTRGLTSSARMGVSGQRRWIEGNTMMAARYRRATAALMTSVTSGGARGDLARNQLAALITGMTLTMGAFTVAMGLEKGKSKKQIEYELKERLIPGNGTYMMADVLGQKVGFGSKFISDVNFITKIFTQPASMLDTNIENNILIRWLRSQAAFAIGDPIDILLGRDVVGNVTRPGTPFLIKGDAPSTRDGVLGLTESVFSLGIPVWVQSAALEGGDIKQRQLRGGFEFVGSRAYQQGRSSALTKASFDRFEKPLEDLNQLERFELQNDLQLAPVLAEFDNARASTGDPFAGYRVQKLEDEAIAYEREYADLMTMITALANVKEYNETWGILKTFADNIGEVKGTLATQLERSRKEKGLDGYVGEEPKNEFDQMLNEWYELFDSHTSTVLNPSGGQAKHRLNFDTWVPASDEFVAALSPELQEQLQQWRDRKQEPEGVQAILEARRPNADKYGLNEEGEPKGPNNEQLFSEVQRVLVELGWTKAQFHSLRESK